MQAPANPAKAPAWPVHPELRAQLARLEELEKRERQQRYARWHVATTVESEPESWLLTYLDLITLLLVMLVVMLAFARPGAQAGDDPATAVAAVIAPTEEAVTDEAVTDEAATDEPQAAPAEPVAAADTEHAPAPPAEEAAGPAPTGDDVATAPQPAPGAALETAPDTQAEPQPEAPAAAPLAIVGSIGTSSWARTAGTPGDPTFATVAELAREAAIPPAPTVPDAAPPPVAEAAPPAVAVETPIDEPPPAQPGMPGPTLEQLGLGDLGKDIDVIVSERTVSLRISNEILFPSGQAILDGDGHPVLDRVADILKRNDYQIIVEGHTDPVPIRNERFPSNWELSTGRATSVLRYLQQAGIPAQRLRAVGYASTRPIASNDNAEGRAINRRVEVILETGPVQ